MLFIGARHPGRPKPLIYHSGDAGGPMMAIFPRKYQRPRYSGMSGCPPCPPLPCSPLPCSCYRPAAGATLQGLCRKGYAAHAPTAALATQIGMLQLLHWPHRSACPKCCTGHADRYAPSAALAIRISMLQLLHWQHRSACSKCCTGDADQHSPRGPAPPSFFIQRMEPSTGALSQILHKYSRRRAR